MRVGPSYEKMFSVLVALLLVSGTTVLGEFGGPYDMHIVAFGECNDVGTHEYVVALKILDRKGKVAHVAGYINLPLGWTEKITATLRAAKLEEGGSGKKDILVKNIGGACSAVRNMAPLPGKQVFNAIGYKDCPVKPGNYSLDFNLSFDFAGVPVFVYGRYKFEIEIYSAKTAKKMGCFYFTSDVVPKKAPRRKVKGIY